MLAIRCAYASFSCSERFSNIDSVCIIIMGSLAVISSAISSSGRVVPFAKRIALVDPFFGLMHAIGFSN